MCLRLRADCVFFPVPFHLHVLSAEWKREDVGRQVLEEILLQLLSSAHSALGPGAVRTQQLDRLHLGPVHVDLFTGCYFRHPLEHGGS